MTSEENCSRVQPASVLQTLQGCMNCGMLQWFLQPAVVFWPLVHFLSSAPCQYDFSYGGSACCKAAAYTQDNTNTDIHASSRIWTCDPQCLNGQRYFNWQWLVCVLVLSLIASVVSWSRVPGYRSRGPGFHSRSYQIFWEVVGLEWGPLSLMSKIEELLGRNSCGFSLESQDYGRGDLLRWLRDTLYLQKLAPTSPTSGSLSFGIVRSQTQATQSFWVLSVSKLCYYMVRWWMKI
jgi:hypothetical protein